MHAKGVNYMYLQIVSHVTMLLEE